MDIEEYQSIYKYLILLNAGKKGWSIYKKDDNIFYLYKEKNKLDKFDLKYDINLLHKEPYNIKKILKEINK